MKSSKRLNKLSGQEKREMLEDAADKTRRDDFRASRKLSPKMSFEEYIHWLSKITSIFPETKPRKFVAYRKVLL
ncbi:MAG: hypothetical protein A2901_00660 [Elusimicrobia bacterium RIFCSPLOWO2_01_FULL_54_10]|nr:MAG: hypothetical protein A2901_00660 [Elusimicrobia bacterium RIFCSPLOWO2_01_FULL_54_10]